MKKIFSIFLLSLFSVAVFAVEAMTLNFDSMRISEDAGKTWSDLMPIQGRFEIQPNSLALVLGDDKQSYSIVSSSEQDGKTLIECTNAQSDKISVSYSPKAKEVNFTTAEGISNFRITKVIK